MPVLRLFPFPSRSNIKGLITLSDNHKGCIQLSTLRRPPSKLPMTNKPLNMKIRIIPTLLHTRILCSIFLMEGLQKFPVFPWRRWDRFRPRDPHCPPAERGWMKAELNPSRDNVKEEQPVACEASGPWGPPFLVDNRKSNLLFYAKNPPKTKRS